MAIPEEDHLFELKEILYETPYKNLVKDTAIDGFSLLRDERVTFEMSLDSKEEITALFKMTPYAYRTPKEAADRLYLLDSLKVTADFRVFAYRKD
jgi:23S rRNA (guanine745-N1)-methyltransferase